MARRGGKAKTRKSVAKRFKITGSGKALRRRPGGRHLAENKTRKRKRYLHKTVLVSEADMKKVTRNLPFG